MAIYLWPKWCDNHNNMLLKIVFDQKKRSLITIMTHILRRFSNNAAFQFGIARFSLYVCEKNKKKKRHALHRIQICTLFPSALHSISVCACLFKFISHLLLFKAILLYQYDYIVDRESRIPLSFDWCYKYISIEHQEKDRPQLDHKQFND